MTEHIDSQRLARFFLRRAPLREEEHEHLELCRHCVTVMVDSRLSRETYHPQMDSARVEKRRAGAGA